MWACNLLESCVLRELREVKAGQRVLDEAAY